MTVGLLTLGGVVVGAWLREAVERRRDVRLLRALGHPLWIANLAPPTTVEIRA